MGEIVGKAHLTSVRGTSVAWGELGGGPPLVLLHGLADSHRTWRRVAPLLGKDFRVLMPDLPGHGWSGRPDASYTLAWHARMVADWMDAVGVARAHVCGHSFGGGVAEWMLLESRSRVDRLALVAAGGLGREVSLPMRLAAVPMLGPALTPPLMWIGALLGPRLFPKAFGYIEPGEARLVARMSRIRGTARAFRRSLASVINVSGQYVQMIDRAHEITSLPAIALFWGAEDPIIPIRHAANLIELSTGVTLTIYPECGHFPQLEAPSAFACALRDFLRAPHPRARMASRRAPSAASSAAPAARGLAAEAGWRR